VGGPDTTTQFVGEGRHPKIVIVRKRYGVYTKTIAFTERRRVSACNDIAGESVKEVSSVTVSFPVLEPKVLKLV